MSIYHRYASREHDEAYFTRTPSRRSKPKNTFRARGPGKAPPAQVRAAAMNNYSGDAPRVRSDDEAIRIPPLQPGGEMEPVWSVSQWNELFPRCAFFVGYDKCFRHVVVMVYQDKRGLCTKSVSRFGVCAYDELIIDASSRFWPACENLAVEHKTSSVRRALAITNLKNYNRVINCEQVRRDHHYRSHSHSLSHQHSLHSRQHSVQHSLSHSIQHSMNSFYEPVHSYDETDAGALASSMEQIEPIGTVLLDHGLLQAHRTRNFILDTVYDNSGAVSAQTVEENNQLVYLLGKQLDQLFDPLLEYLPERLWYQYDVPEEYVAPEVQSQLIDDILQEFLAVQTKYTMGLVNLLQNLIIPLRIHVLSQASNSGMAKINLVFPPTIDEVTRVNCILHEALGRASKYGYVEVFRVCAGIMPYFYKAFIRHEANLSNFSKRLHRFSSKNAARVFDNPDVNKGEYSLQEIDSVVQGSLLELPKLRMLLERLRGAVKDGFEKKDVPKDPKISMVASVLDLAAKKIPTENEAFILDKCLEVCTSVVDAFGSGISDPEESVLESPRVFTPSGKLLVKLAHNWPSELQYNWHSRNVVGIFAEKHEEKNDNTCQIVMIFSDYLVFLSIDHTQSSVSPADLLMHILINEKPLQLPSMTVTAWCDINDVLVSTFDSPSGPKMRFLSVTDGFSHGTKRNSRVSSRPMAQTFSVPDEIASDQITELIMKARVLHKSQPFHLFRSDEGGLAMYSTAQQIQAYEEEQCVAPFALFLNMQIEDPVRYFQRHPRLHLIMQASYLSADHIQLMAYNRDSEFLYNEIVSERDFAASLRGIIAHNFAAMVRSRNRVTNAMAKTYAQILSTIGDPILSTVQLRRSQSTLPGSEPSGSIHSAQEVMIRKEKVSMVRLSKTDESIEERRIQQDWLREEKRREREEKRREREEKRREEEKHEKREEEKREREKKANELKKEEKANEKREEEKAKLKKEKKQEHEEKLSDDTSLDACFPLKRRKSFLCKLIDNLRRRELKTPETTPKQALASPVPALANDIHLSSVEVDSVHTRASSPLPSPSLPRNISDTYIPRGHRSEYGCLVSPVPELRIERRHTMHNMQDLQPSAEVKAGVDDILIKADDIMEKEDVGDNRFSVHSSPRKLNNGSEPSMRINQRLHLPGQPRDSRASEDFDYREYKDGNDFREYDNGKITQYVGAMHGYGGSGPCMWDGKLDYNSDPMSGKLDSSWAGKLDEGMNRSTSEPLLRPDAPFREDPESSLNRSNSEPNNSGPSRLSTATIKSSTLETSLYKSLESVLTPQVQSEASTAASLSTQDMNENEHTFVESDEEWNRGLTPGRSMDHMGVSTPVRKKVRRRKSGRNTAPQTLLAPHVIIGEADPGSPVQGTPATATTIADTMASSSPITEIAKELSDWKVSETRYSEKTLKTAVSLNTPRNAFSERKNQKLTPKELTEVKDTEVKESEAKSDKAFNEAKHSGAVNEPKVNKAVNDASNATPKSTKVTTTETPIFSSKRYKSMKDSLPNVPPLDLDHIPLRDFYADGQANWVTFSRDNSSIESEKYKALQEPFGEIKPVKYKVKVKRKDTETKEVEVPKPPIDLSDPVSMRRKVHDSPVFRIVKAEPKISDFIHSKRSSVSSFEVPRYFNNDSEPSLTSSQVIEEFSKAIEFGDDLESLLNKSFDYAPNVPVPVQSAPDSPYRELSRVQEDSREELSENVDSSNESDPSNIYSSKIHTPSIHSIHSRSHSVSSSVQSSPSNLSDDSLELLDVPSVSRRSYTSPTKPPEVAHPYSGRIGQFSTSSLFGSKKSSGIFSSRENVPKDYVRKIADIPRRFDDFEVRSRLSREMYSDYDSGSEKKESDRESEKKESDPDTEEKESDQEKAEYWRFDKRDSRYSESSRSDYRKSPMTMSVHSNFTGITRVDSPNSSEEEFYSPDEFEFNWKEARGETVGKEKCRDTSMDYLQDLLCGNVELGAD